MINTKYQTALRRLAASLIDGFIIIPILIVENILRNKNPSEIIIVTWYSLASFLPIFYSIFFHYYYGRTIGKAITGLKVLDVSEIRTLTLQQAILRDSFYLIVQLIGFIYYFILYQRIQNSNLFIEGYSSFTDFPLLIWMIIELTSMFTNSKRRAIHDLIAKSVVIKQ